MMKEITPKTQQMLDVLKQVATETIERKRRLGQYAVVWRDNQPAILNVLPEHEGVEQSPQELRFLSALTLYRQRHLSLGKAAELAGFSKLDFIERLIKENEPIFDYSEAEMDEVFADVKKLSFHS